MKGISIVERHFEKAVLALVALAVGGFAAWDFVSDTKVKLGGSEAGVAEIAPKLKKLSDEVSSAQGGTEVSIEIPPVPEGASNATALIDRAAVPGDPLPKVMPPLASALFSNASRPVPLYHEPVLGPVRMISPVLQSDGAVKIVAGKDESLVAFLDARPAGWQKGDADVIWTTPVAEVDLAAIRAEFEKAELGANPPREKLPLHWWQQRDRGVCVLDVRFEREEQQSDGTWGPAVAVEALPGIATFRGVDLPNVSAVVERMKANQGMQERILRPPFPALAKGTAPDPRGGPKGGGVTESKELAAARKSLDAAKKRLEEVTVKLDEAGGEYNEPAAGAKGKGKGKGGGGDPNPSPGGGGGSKGGGSPSGGGFGPGAGGDGGTDADSPAAIRKRRNLTQERDKAKVEVAKFEAQITELSKPAPTGEGSAAPAAGERYLVWAHDLKIRPGAVYRYRCVLSVLNPFLGRAVEVQESQRSLASKSGLLTAPSEWVSVRTRSPRDFFLIEALPGEGASGLGLGRFDLFTLDNGQWCAQRDTIELGDRVGGVMKATVDGGKEADVDFTTDWYVIGVYRDFASEAAAARSGRKGGEGASGDRQMMVVLANANDPSQIIVRRPADDAAAPDRAFLSQRAAPGKTAGGGAAASGDGKKG